MINLLTNYFCLFLFQTVYAHREGLAGVMAYSIEMDDFNGDCKDINNDEYSHPKYPLLQSINDALERPNSASSLSSPITLIAAITLLHQLPNFINHFFSSIKNSK